MKLYFLFVINSQHRNVPEMCWRCQSLCFLPPTALRSLNIDHWAMLERQKPFRGASVDWIEFGEFDALRQGLIKHVHSTFHCEIVQTQSKRVKVNNECGIKWIDINCACIVSLIDEALKAALNLPSAQLIMYRCCHQTTAISTLPQCPRDSKLCCIAKRCKLIFKLAWTNIKRGYKSKPQYESALAVYIESILGDTSYSSI